MASKSQGSNTPVGADAFSEKEKRGLYRAIFSRRDIRTFKSDPIPPEVLARIISAAHHGPSVGFMQPWDFIMVQDAAMRQKVKDLFDRERQAASSFFDEPRRSHYLSLKLEGILESPVNLRPDPGRSGLGAEFDPGDGPIFDLLRRPEPMVGGQV